MMSDLLDLNNDVHRQVDAMIEDLNIFYPDDCENPKEELIRLVNNLIAGIEAMLKEGWCVRGSEPRWQGCRYALIRLRLCMREPDQDIHTLQDVACYMIPWKNERM